MDTNNETCNGWTNYATWCIASILMNDEKHYYHVCKFCEPSSIERYCESVGMPTEDVNFAEIAESI